MHVDARSQLCAREEKLATADEVPRVESSVRSVALLKDFRNVYVTVIARQQKCIYVKRSHTYVTPNATWANHVAKSDSLYI